MNPFDILEEWFLTLPAGQSLKVPSLEFKLVFFLEGDLAMSIPGQAPIRLSKGDAYSLSLPTTQTYHSLRSESDTRVHLLRLAFRWPVSSQSILPPKSKSPKPEKQFEEALRRRLTGFQYFPNTLFGDHYPISRRILSEMERQNEASPWKISGLCQTLTAGLLSEEMGELDRLTTPPRPRGDAAIEHALQYLEENCHNALTLSTIAWQVQLSGEHLARLFKQHTGRTVFGWLDHFRTEKARNLLTTTEWPLAQIAHASGYSSAILLNRHFKKNTGCPPIAYRRKIQKGEYFSRSDFSSESVGQSLL